MEKIGISTVVSGYNYGTSLQAYATKMIFNEMGFISEHVVLKGTLMKGRDVRLSKIINISFRLVFNPRQFIRSLNIFLNSSKIEVSTLSKEQFDDFNSKYIKPNYYDWRKLKREAHTDEFLAFVCGSDQIWNSEALYVNPLYYLRFSPKFKRIALAPSFGRDFIPKYNTNKIGRYIRDIPSLSIREKSGVSLIKNISGRDACNLLDPTLLIDGNKWITHLGLLNQNIYDNKYVLAYFLNSPSPEALDYIEKYAKTTKLKIVSLSKSTSGDVWYDVSVDAGPIEFLKLLNNAECVFTDSFHGTAFSINLRKPFYTFERQYGKAGRQSTRIISLLETVSMLDCFNPHIIDINKKYDFEYSSKVLNDERLKAKKYIDDAINNVRCKL